MDNCQDGACAITPPVGTFDYCSVHRPTYRTAVVANLDLRENSPDRPVIDGIIDNNDEFGAKYGWDGEEYKSFTPLNMYVNGNPAKDLVAKALIAYDCQNKILCKSPHFLCISVKSIIFIF